jgi:tripartite-type tricarboxylate transporter receptor subunit TctC
MDSHETSVTRRVLLAGAACMTAAALLPAHAAAVKTTHLRFLIGSNTGYAEYSRLFMKHLARLNPDLRTDVESVPEADGRLAAKRIFESAPDPLEIGMFETSLLYAALLGEDTSAFDFAKFRWVGKLATDPRLVIVSKASGIRSLDELRARPEAVVFPTSSITSRSAVEALLLNALLDLRLKPVPGFTGAERQLALINGEGEVLAGSYPSLDKLILDEGAVPILRLNDFELPGVSKDVPVLRDVAAQPVSPIVDLIELSGRLSRLIAAPAEIDKEELSALQAMFDGVVADADFRKEAGEAGLPIDTLPGPEVEQLIAGLFARKAEVGADLATMSACGQKRAEGGSC